MNPPDVQVEEEEEEETAPLEGADALRACLRVCGLVDDQENAVMEEGFPDIFSFRFMDRKSLSEMVKRIASLRRGAVRIGEFQLRNMEAFAWWIRDMKRRDRDIVAEKFDDETLETCLDEMELETGEEKDDDVALSKFKETFTGYVQWEVELSNYLSGLKGKSGVPLVYVIRKQEEIPDNAQFVSTVEELIAEAPLTGPVFLEDAKRVYRIVKAACLGTNGWEWIKEFDKYENGRRAVMAL